MSELRFYDVNGITFSVSQAGDPQKPTIAFINSLGANFRIWNRLTSHLLNDFSIVCYDKRGHGLSDTPAGPYSIHDHATDLAGLLDVLKIDKAIIVGISVGGQIAIDFGLNFKAKTEALVLADTGAKIGTFDAWTERIDTLRKSGISSISQGVVGNWFTEKYAEENRAEVAGCINMLQRTPVEGYVATCEALRDADYSHELAQLAVPTLVVCGAQDKSTPLRLSEDLTSAIPQARINLIDQAGHLPCIEQHEKMADCIQAFCESLK